MASTSSGCYATSTVNKQVVLDFVQLCLEDSPNQPVTVQDLVSRLFVSKTSLASQTKKAMGLSPLQFLRSVRLEQVRRGLLLSEGRANIGDLARQYGFSSRGHFSKNYHQLFERNSETLAKSLL